MNRSAINSQRDRSYKRMLKSRPGTMQIKSGPVIPCGLTIGSDTRETADGGFTRVRTATVWVSRESLPVIPNLTARETVTLTQQGLEPEKFRLMESHSQSENHWLLRFFQTG